MSTFAHWAIVELMGHRRLAGYVEEVELFGGKMMRLDVPSEPPVTQFYGPSAIYAVTPTTEEVARAFARDRQPRPVERYELALPSPSRPSSIDVEPSDDLDDDDGWDPEEP